MSELGGQVYANLMAEAHVRIKALDQLLNNYQAWPPVVLQDFCYLQLRLLCEMIGLGCLIAHGDITNRNLLKNWDIPRVMRSLEELKPNFFPVPIKMTFANGSMNVEPSNAPALTKDELFDLYDLAGSKLHRGSAKSLMAEIDTQKIIVVDEIVVWAKKIIDLLEQHRIASTDGRRNWIVALNHVESNGMPSLWETEALEPDSSVAT